MKLPPIKSWFSAPLLIPCLIFLLVNTSTSHALYHVNSFKISLMILGITCFAMRNLPLFPSSTSNRTPWKIWLFLAAPLLATIPGLIWHQGSFNYNLRYELATNLVLFLWVVYLFRSVHQEDDISLLMFFIGIVIIYNGGWSILEKTGFHPLYWNEPAGMVKATFGHRNYYSGFLIILLPMMLVFAVPDRIFTQDAGQKQQIEPSRMYLFYLAVFLLGCLGLFMAQTRAAIVAFLLSLALVCLLYVTYFAARHWRKRLLIIYTLGIAAGACLMILLLIYPDLFGRSRFTQLLSLKGWVGRLLAWETAFSAIKVSPLTGYGLGSSYNLFFSFVDPDARLYHSEHSYNHAHSEILEYMQEGGVIGLVVYIGFWAWLVYRLIKLLKNPETSPTCLKLGIGICGGLLAYHIHGSFSVAPRMMVTKLALYTLIAFVFIIHHLQSHDRDLEPETTSLHSRMLSGLPTLLVLAVIWTIFLPWASRQWLFTNIYRERASYLQIRKLEALVKLSPDIYALDHLARRQIEYKQLQGLERTLKSIEQIIPHYRNLEYKKTWLAAIRGDITNSKQLGLLSQQQDRYYQPAMDHLIRLSIETSDLPLFKVQFALSLRKHLFGHRLVEGMDAGQAQIHFLPMEVPLKIVSKSDTLTFQLGEKLIGRLFQTAHENHRQKFFSSEKKRKYQLYLMQQLGRQPYFQMNFLPQFKDETAMLRQAARDYFSVTREWKERKAQLEQGFQAELMKTLPAERRSVYRKQQQELLTLRQPYDEKLNGFAGGLREKTDWDLFLKKQTFSETFLQWIITVIFPAGQ